MKLGRQGQHLTCILAPDSPLHETPILAARHCRNSNLDKS
jgi:hypothetical protein